MDQRVTHLLSLGPLAGYRTVLCGIGMVLLSGLHAQGYLGDQTYATWKDILLGGGLVALRAAIGK